MILITLAIILLITYVIYLLRYKKSNKVNVVVLGDIGRSPRMQYHSISLAKHGYSVEIIGYGGSMPTYDVVANKSISRYHMIEPPKSINKLPKLLVYALKALHQGVALLVPLLYHSRANIILLQNPPAIPTLAVCLLVAFVRRSRLIVDWHNYAFTIMAMSAGQQHPIVKFAKRYETILGRYSHANLCVTEAMQADLQREYSIRATVLHDKAPEMFQPTSLEQKHELFTRLAEEYPVFNCDRTNGNVFTEESRDGVLTMRGDRPALIVSSTSWTEDEDFSILLNSLQTYDTDYVEGESVNIICVITGKGPLKQYYLNKIQQIDFKHVEFCTPWLQPTDYPLLLGSADLGVCLHVSSSGLDLPMKVVDMFGCEVPVLAVHFSCLSELVKDGLNGMIFHNDKELCDQLKLTLQGFPSKCSRLNDLRSYLHDSDKVTWQRHWNAIVTPLLADA